MPKSSHDLPDDGDGNAPKADAVSDKFRIKRTVAPKSWGPYPYKINIKDLKDPRPLVPLSKAVVTHLFDVGATVGTTALLCNGYIAAGIAAGLAGATALGFAYRGLECLVHGASHYDVHPDEKTNDLLGDALMALPVLQTVRSFRRNHLDLHHSAFAGGQDPCRIRMAQHADVQRGDLPTLPQTLRGLPREIREFYSTVGSSRRTLALGGSWHFAVFAALSAASYVLSQNPAETIAVLIATRAALLLAVFFGSLPLVRAIAEAGEHNYARLDLEPASQVERTFDNIGVVNSLIHPYGDKWHIEHHLYPGIPQYRLAEVNRRLLDKGYGIYMQYRIEPLGQPRPFSDAVLAPIRQDGVISEENPTPKISTDANHRSVV